MNGAGAILLIDAGNTRVKFGWMRRRHHGLREAGTLALGHAELARLPEWLATRPLAPDEAVGVSVAGEAVAAQIERILMLRRNIPVRWLRSSAQAAGITNLYERPEQLGNDRWISLVGLSRHTPGAAILASFGTATTVDTLGPLHGPARALPAGADMQAESRRFEGGIILPGPELMRRSLASGTAGLPYAQGDSVAFPRSTHSAISSGIAAAQAGAVVRQWRCAFDSLGLVPQVFCTGGGWPLVADEVTAALARAQADRRLPPVAPQWLDAPVLDGLAALAQEAAG